MEINKENKIELCKLIESNYISKIKHPFHNIFLLSYTKKTALEANWNELTLNTRGLIVDQNYNIISRPFKKFFEPSQLTDNFIIPHELNYKIYEKLDGSLLISYWIEDSFFLTTKGKFDSFQSIIGNRIFKSKYSHLIPQMNKNYTYIFELISSETTNIVDYGNLEDLFLLDVINTTSNESIDFESLTGFKTPKKYNITFTEAIMNKDALPEEGYVIHFENDFRLKIKKGKFKLQYHKHQSFKREILNNIYNSRPFELGSGNKSEQELIKFKDLYEKAINLLEFIHFYLKSDINDSGKLEIIEIFKHHYKDNKKLDFFILERLYSTSQYYSLKVPYDVSFLKS
ncbi:RNA ligase [Flavobacterium sp.]|uniref:RNA ligase n=1 Tax=Flavobacterium sp. TaxID=239 RepID=UPI00261284FF|nr:RNA ligase [Flavobacterium sp.]MDD2984754.1 RNA ligase [Flavobacterium sp.]